MGVGVSIHAPVWGATLACHKDYSYLSFNPRTRVGCDLVDHPDQWGDNVSIHAPVWGATAFFRV